MLALLLAGATLTRAGAPASIDSAAVKETRQVGGDVRVERVTVVLRENVIHPAITITVSSDAPRLPAEHAPGRSDRTFRDGST